MTVDDVAQPLVSCIMPTYNRRAFVNLAIDCFLRQGYGNRELIIVDDGTDPVGDLVPPDERLRYIRLPGKTTVGAKRNLACDQARGDIIVHWDDDDWHASHRLEYQVEALVQSGADICGITTLLFYDMQTGRAWEYVYPRHQNRWLSGSSLCYTRALWAGNRFPNVDVGEDTQFVWGAGHTGRVTVLPEQTFHVGIIHAHNVSPKPTHGAYWHPYPLEAIQRLLGDSWSFYSTRSAERPDEGRLPGPAAPLLERTVPAFTAANTADLALTEFAALNHGQNLPWMRRWELPFALFQSRLDNTMAVLDCTINPAGFRERLGRLYPHVLYRHCAAIQNGQFTLPLGVPDESFDRVICVNTLEHLTADQRDALMGAMVRTLKPGGSLILTSDYYFAASWEQPSFLAAGVMRADRLEIFNGWNKVTPRMYLNLTERHGLQPPGELIDDPREEDAGLYLNQPPYRHACIAGVFRKSGAGEAPAAKRIVLALLTWNTQDASMESVLAHAAEARMLRRLGHTPLVCVCDNGSTDGTAAALQAAADRLDIPCKLILNRENLGSSRARNQIIDYMRECDADYLLFVDGDIEIVPFSSFAMLRYLENNGSKVGCIGANYMVHTPSREQASRYLYSIDSGSVHTFEHFALTQYGLFRREVFEDGVRFDETEPFNGPGWGLEDNDLMFQMTVRGYLNQYFDGMRYLHRAAQSSIRLLREHGVDVAALHARRKQYVVEKWSSVPCINNGPLAQVRRYPSFL